MVFTTDIDINKAYPAVQFDPTAPETGFTYFEDREVNGIMYRVQNAYYDTTGLKWRGKDTTKPAYAIAQMPDGSNSHFTKAHTIAPWTTWDGNQQRGIYDVRDFGAKANGLDDSGAIQAANDAAVSNGGGYIYLPPGNYAIQNAILLGSPTAKTVPITLGGAGAELSTLTALPGINGGANTIIVANHQWSSATTSVVQTDIYIEKLGFNGSAASNPATGDFKALVLLKQVQNCGVTDCEVVNSSGSGIAISGDETASDWPVSSDNLNFEVLRNHVNLTSASLSHPGLYPIKIVGANIGIVRDNAIGDSSIGGTSDGIYCPGSSHVEISDNYVASCTNAIVANASTDVIVANNRITSPNGFGISTAASGLLGKSGVTNLTITGNIVVTPVDSGIRVSCPPSTLFLSNFAVTGNVIVLPSSGSGPYGIHIEASQGSVTGNTIDLGGSSLTGLSIDSTASGGNERVTVIGNTICNGGSSANGIVFTTGTSTTSSYCVISGNNLAGIPNPLSTNFNAMVDCVVRSNPGLNPWAQATTTPPLGTSPATVNNTYPFDIWVTLSGTVITTVSINGNVSGVKAGNILLPGGSANYITVTYTGHTAPTWKWLAY